MVGHAGRAIRCRCPTRPPWQQWSLILIAAAIRHLLYTSSSSRFSRIGFRRRSSLLLLVPKIATFGFDLIKMSASTS